MTIEEGRDVKREERAVWKMIRAERRNQEVEWGGPEDDMFYTDLSWAGLIIKHLGRSITRPSKMKEVDYHRLYVVSMVRVAALAVAAVLWVNRKYNWSEFECQAGHTPYTPHLTFFVHEGLASMINTDDLKDDDDDNP